MNKGKRFIFWVLVLVVVIVFGWFAYDRYVSRTAQQIAGDSSTGPLKVIAEAVKRSKISETIAVTGTFDPLASVEVIPEISGRLQRLRLPDGTLIDIGTEIHTGDTVAVIEHAAAEATVQQAQAALQTAQAALQTARVTLQDAQRERNRMEELYKGGAIPQQQYDAACTVCDKAEAGLAVAQANIKQAEAALAGAKVTLDKATIRSPITGVVSKKYVDEGDMVGPATPLVRIVQMETLKVFGGVSERYLRRLTPGKTAVTIKTDAYPQDEFIGTVYKVGVAVDPATRTGEVEIRVPNSDMRLKPGMFARMTVVLSEKDDVVVVSDSALIREQGGTYVFVANDSKARRREVKLGLSQGAYHEVLQGLAAGDLVITRGQGQLQDGQAIEVVEETDK
jgi:RND family efflux transporter MFP subunit